MESKAGERHEVRRAVRTARDADDRRCPPLLDVACLESGDLSEFRRAVVNDHSRGCARCGTSLAELRQARTEILGATDSTRRVRSRRAAEEIQRLLRDRLH